MDTYFLRTICDTCGRTLRVIPIETIEGTTYSVHSTCICTMGYGQLWDDTVKGGHPVPPQVDRTKEGST